ncbi:MAG TPA: response regulator [Nitrospirota bacterium]|nr:response regulator [Nitrospirota bacterium]
MHEQVLIVEDEQDVVELLRYNLEKENYRVLVAHSGEEAIAIVPCQMPDVVLLDIMLPELNGWEVCRILREGANGKSVPIIMLTALSSEEARIQGLTLGADDYVSKPFSIRELMLKIRKLINRQRTLKMIQAKTQEQDTSLRYLVHELKNSINVIGGFSALGLRKEGAQDYLRTINVAAAHAESLLNDASLLSRLENKQGSLPMESLDIGSIVDEVVDVFRDTAKNRQIEIVLENKTSSLITGNSTAVRQVLMNLLSNAVKYNRHGGRVWMTVERIHDGIDISITDEGCGILCDEIPKIFNKFYRADGSEQIKGAGLGLYIVKLLIEAMGGNISAVSRPGVGSTFTVSFQKPNAINEDPDKSKEQVAPAS